MLSNSEKRELTKLKTLATDVLPASLVIVTDAGRDHDDEVALAIACGLMKLGLVDIKGVITTLKPATERAKLVKGMLTELGFDNIPVAAGSDINDSYTVRNNEFNAPYFAKDYVAPLTGYQLLEKTFAEADDHSLTLLLIAGMTDVARFVNDHPELTKQKLKQVTIMGGVETEDGSVKLDTSGHMIPDSAYNNNVDMPAARLVYQRLQELGIPMQVLTRNASYEVASEHLLEKIIRAKNKDVGTWAETVDRVFDIMERCPDFPAAFTSHFFNRLHDSGSPIGVRLHSEQANAIQHLWERVNYPHDDPRREGLPTRLNREWFLETFTDDPSQTEEKLKTEPEIWNHVSKLNPYDPLTLLAAVLPQNYGLFEPTNQIIDSTSHSVIGLNSDQPGIARNERIIDILTALALFGITREREIANLPVTRDSRLYASSNSEGAHL